MTRRDPTVPASRLIALTAFALVVTTATSAIAQTTGRIEGTITDSRTRQPLGAASVFIQGTGIGTQTNERGRYVLVNVPSGRYEVRVRRIGYQNLAKSTTVADQPVTLDFDLSEAAVSLDEVVVTGTALATRAKEVPTSTDIVNFACISGDFNEVHVNHEYCKTTPFGEPIAHGPLVYAIMGGAAAVAIGAVAKQTER